MKPEKEQPRGPIRLLLLLPEAGHRPRADLETGHDRSDILGITGVYDLKKKKQDEKKKTFRALK